MHLDKFYKNSFILSASNMITGIIGFIFSVILSRELGAEGLGLYSLVMPLYILFLCLASDGLITALSKISAIYYNKKDVKSLNRTMSATFMLIFVWSVSIAVLAFVFSPAISSILIGDTRSAGAVRIICPAIVLVSMSAVLKGYYYGMNWFKPAAFIDMGEKLLRVGVLLAIISVLPVRNVENTVTAAYTSLAVGELISFGLLYAYYKRNRSMSMPFAPKQKHRRLQLLFNVLAISFPLCINGFISTLLSAAESLVLPRRLVSAGIPYDAALELMGKFIGMAFNITCLPMIIVNSMSTVLVPDLSLSISRNNYWAAEDRMLQVFRVSCIIGTSSLIIGICIPDLLGSLLYNRSDLGKMIVFASISSFISFIALPTFGMLNGLGRQKVLLKNSLIVSVQGLVLIYILAGIPSVNIYGYGITNMIVSASALIMNFREIKKELDFKFPFSEIIKILIIGLFSFLIISLVNQFVPDTLAVIKTVFTALLAFGLVYGFYRLIED